MSHIDHKHGLVDELAVVMKRKFTEKEPRACWCDNPLPLDTIEAWLRREIEELLAAPPGEEMREAADVANMAAIYADVRRRSRQGPTR